MIRLKTVIAALLVLVYPLLAGYCLLEKTGFVASVDCCAETTSHGQDEKSSCGGYGCCPIEYAVYSSFDTSTADFTTPPADVVLLMTVLLPEPPATVPIALPERSPPDIPKSWQFAFRTALSPRAPSFVS